DRYVTSDPVVRVRSYRQDDADLTLTVFLNAVQITATANYTPEQIAAWARPNNRNIAEWDQQRRSRETIVAMVGEKVAGFSDLDSSGLIDMIFVDPAYGRR